MDQQNERSQVHDFDRYINGSYDNDVDNVLTLFQDPLPNNNQFSYHPTMNLNNRDGIYHP